MTREDEIKNIALCYAHDELKDNHGDVEDIVASAFIDGTNYADSHPHWISVEDELPKNKELVFITDGEYTDTGFYEYTFDEWQPCEKWLGDITHWMPLPQAPKEGE